MSDTVRTTCPYCGVGCGVCVTVDAASGEVSVKGDPNHPANFGRLCSKGSALAETLSPNRRLTEPEINGEAVTWNAALDTVANGFAKTIAEHGPDSVAFYVSGQLMTEAYYVANKLMKGFIGSSNIDTNSRLCMASSVVGHKRAFGADVVPANYEDLELADLVVLVGSNLAWCHPVLYQRLAAARKKRGTKVVVIDPRRTATCDIADLHLALKPGSDVALFNGLFDHLSGKPTDVAQACDLAPNDVDTFFELVRNTEKTVTVYSQGVNQSSQGSDKVNAILNTHLVLDRIGKPGCGPLSVTGQPNAMGGREVGGLANTLACHMDFDQADLVGQFWNAPYISTAPGLKAVDMFEAIHDGRIKAVWIMATNPAVSLPNTARVREALDKCPLVVVSDCVDDTDTIRYADVVLPSTTWGERDGTVTNSERRISRQRPFRFSPGLAQEDWQIICDVAERMGFGKAFTYDSPAAIFNEYAKLSAHQNNGTRAFDIGGLADADYETLEPVQWPVHADGTGTARLFADGKFFTPSGQANIINVMPSAPKTKAQDGQIILNTGRLRDQWHTMTRSGLSARLTAHHEEPFIALHPNDAERFGVEHGDIAEVSNDLGRLRVRALHDDGQRMGEAFMPIHWSRTFSGAASVCDLISANVDPHSGQPEFKHAAVSVKPFAHDWQALVVSRDAFTPSGDVYWSRAQASCHLRTWVAGSGELEADLGEGEWIEYSDPAKGRSHRALIKDGRLEAAVFLSTERAFPARAWLESMFAQTVLDDSNRQGILAGRAPGVTLDPGPTVCACFNVGANTLMRAIESGSALSVEAIGELLQAGTNCGSCKPEIQGLFDSLNATRLRA